MKFDKMQIRWHAVAPLVISFVAFVLALICVSAGSKRGYLENIDLLTLNTSMLGRLTPNASKSHSPLLNSVESSIKGDINSLAADIAKDLHIHDFYSAHILDYCEVGRPLVLSRANMLITSLLGLLHTRSGSQYHSTLKQECH